MGDVNFFELIGPGGKAGARQRFEALISQLVRLRFGNATMRVNGEGGDWGLDTIVGSFDTGAIDAFQAKFFIDGIGSSQQAQIRRSFDAAIAGQENGHELASWTLCIPVCLDPRSARWWSGWKARSEARSGVRIALWDATALEELLLDPTARNIREAYFPRSAPVAEQARRRLTGQRSQVREIAPTRLRNRQEELEGLRQFAKSDEQYLHVVAPPWAGKTALVSSFVLDPPRGVEVASFFVTAGLAGRNDSQAFLVAVAGQLAALVGEPPPSPRDFGPEFAESEYRRLLEEAAARLRASGKRLVLAVDGLDEDESLVGARNLPSIASRLPRVPIAGLGVLVSSRPNPDIPADAHPDHPLHRARRLTIAPSSHASELGRLAERELMGHLAREEAAFDIVSCLCAAGDGLGVAELAEVIGEARHQVKRLVDRFFGRSLVNREAVKGEEPVLFFAHAALRDTAAELVADRTDFWRTQIDAWADAYRAKDWPQTTPRYLVWSYAQALAERRKLRRMVELACDDRRADLLADRTGGDGRALQEMLRVERAVRAESETDLASLTRLAVHRTRLQRRSGGFPDSLPSLWAALGDVDRAARTADVLRWHSRTSSLTSALSTLLDMQRWEDAGRLIELLPPPAREEAAKSLAEARFGPPEAAPGPERRKTPARSPDRVVDPATALAIAEPDPDRALALLEPECDVPARRHTRLIKALAGAAVYEDREARSPTLARALSDEVISALRNHRKYTPRPGMKGDPMLLHAGLIALGELALPHVTDELCGLVDAAMAARDWDALRGLLTQSARGELAPEAAVAHARRCASWLDSAVADQHIGEMAATLQECGELSSEDRMIIHACHGEWTLAEQRALEELPRGRRLRRLSLWRGLAFAWDDALRISGQIGGDAEVNARSELARLMAATGEHERAERVVESLPGHYRAKALAAVATEMAAGGAESVAIRLAEQLPDDYQRAEALAEIAMAVPPGEGQASAHRSHELAASLPGDVFRSRLLTTLVASGCAVGPGRGTLLDRVEDLTGSLSNPPRRAEVLARLARAVHASEPDRAAELAAAAIPLIEYADSDTAEAAAEVLGLCGRWPEAERAMAKLGGSWRRGTRDCLARVAIRRDLQLALRICDPGPEEQAWSGYHNRRVDWEAAAAVASALCHRGRSEEAASLLVRHPLGLKAAISALESPDPSLAPLVGVAIELIGAHPDHQHEHLREDLFGALVAGGRFPEAESLVRGASDTHAEKLMVSLATKLLAAGHDDNALFWARQAAEEGEQGRQKVALAFANAGRADQAAELLGEQAPSRDVGIAIASGLALSGSIAAAKRMIERLPRAEHAKAWSAVGLALAPSRPEEARRCALLAESEGTTSEPLAELIQLAAVQLAPSEMRNELVELAASFERAPFTEGFAVLLYGRGHRVSAFARYPGPFRNDLRRAELEQIALYEAASSGSEPRALCERLAEMAFADDDPRLAADMLCVFAGSLSSEEDRQAARLLVDRAIELVPRITPERAPWVLLAAAEAIASTDTKLASRLLCRAAKAVRHDARRVDRIRAVARLARLETLVHDAETAESSVLGFDAADRGRAFAYFCECPREDDSVPWSNLVARAERSADDAANADEASGVLTWLACAVAAKDPERARRLASAAVYHDEEWRPMTELAQEFLKLGMVGDAFTVMGQVPSPWNDDFPMICDAAVRVLIGNGNWQRAEELALDTSMGTEALKTFVRALSRAGRWEQLAGLDDQTKAANDADPLLMAIARRKLSTDPKRSETYSAELRAEAVKLLGRDHWPNDVWLLNQIDEQVIRVVAEEALKICRQ